MYKNHKIIIYMNQTNNKQNITNSEDNLPPETLYQLACRINQSIVMAEDYLINSRPPNILNNVIKINNQDIDMYDYLINKNHLNVGEYAFIAYDINNNNSWYVRKTHDHLLQYYYLTEEDDYYYFRLFINGCYERYYP